MSIWGQSYLQDSCSLILFYISSFHDHVMVVVCSVIVIILYVLTAICINWSVSRSMFHSEHLEMIWTIIPCVTLMLTAIPSLQILYLVDEVAHPLLTVKVVGHQWYWSYEYDDFDHLSFDSYMVQSELEEVSFAYLEVDNNLIVPLNSEIRILITSADVIHSWTVPSLGVKADGVTGRLNQMSLFSLQSGLMYGQCSEICGSLHSFMPICVEPVPMLNFMQWAKQS